VLQILFHTKNAIDANSNAYNHFSSDQSQTVVMAISWPLVEIF